MGHAYKRSIDFYSLQALLSSHLRASRLSTKIWHDRGNKKVDGLHGQAIYRFLILELLSVQVNGDEGMLSILVLSNLNQEVR